MINDLGWEIFLCEITQDPIKQYIVRCSRDRIARERRFQLLRHLTMAFAGDGGL